jgi:hypothetical protein
VSLSLKGVVSGSGAMILESPAYRKMTSNLLWILYGISDLIVPNQGAMLLCPILDISAFLSIQLIFLSFPVLPHYPPQFPCGEFLRCVFMP